MLEILYALGMFIVDLFKSRSRLEAEPFLPSPVELGVTAEASSRPTAGQCRALLVWMVRLWPCLLGVVMTTTSKGGADVSVLAHPSRIAEERHEPEIHVQLLVAMEERLARIVGDEIEFNFLKAAQHHHVLDDASGWLAAEPDQFETVPVQVQRMNVITGIAEFEPVAVALMYRIHRLHRLHRERFAVEGPLVEPIQRAVVFDDRHLDCLIGRGGRRIRFAKARVVPAERLGLYPLRLALGARVFNDNAHAMLAVVIGQVAHDPHADMIHLDNGGDAFRPADPEYPPAGRG